MTKESFTISTYGMSVVEICVQVHIASGIPAFNIVGLPDKSIAESKERIRVALNSIGLALPPKRITVNLSPADIYKEGTHYDLAITAGILSEMEIIPEELINSFIIMGELALDGKITSVPGVLPAAMKALENQKKFMCPKDNGSEAAWAGEIEIVTPSNLLEMINYFKGNIVIIPPKIGKIINDTSGYQVDLKDIKGQHTAKRALEIAAAGGHNLLLPGTPGTGKSLLAKSIIGILPELRTEELLENMIISSISGKLSTSEFNSSRPFRSPHHSCSMAAMIGGGKKVQPGEVTLSNNGILFLDETPEFSQQVLDALRQPMESKDVTVSRASHHITFPANFQLIAAMNPCKCGYLSETAKECKRAPICGKEYAKKISGPILDRIDICVDVPYLSASEMMKNGTSESSEIVRNRVETAYTIQKARFKGLKIQNNSSISDEHFDEYCTKKCTTLQDLNKFADQYRISMRSYKKIIKVARTISDLDTSDIIKKEHILEAISLSKRKVEFCV